ncbi:MAG: tetratricopeptide repeat protein [Saprospiraceae bacterium]
MNKTQAIVVGIGLLLIAGLYFLPIKSQKSIDTDKTRSLTMELTDESTLIKEAEQKYTPNQMLQVRTMIEFMASETDDSLKLDQMAKISGQWYQLGEPALAGIYAEKIAEKRDTEESWGIAGTTYAAGMRKYEDGKNKTFSRNKAVKAFENAISINPESSNNRVNLALCYVEMPLQNQPMKGILMLRDMLDKNPDDVMALTQLGRLAIRTGQFEKAIERLSKARSIEPNNEKVRLLLLQAYEATGNINAANALKAQD